MGSVLAHDACGCTALVTGADVEHDVGGADPGAATWLVTKVSWAIGKHFFALLKDGYEGLGADEINHSVAEGDWKGEATAHRELRLGQLGFEEVAETIVAEDVGAWAAVDVRKFEDVGTNMTLVVLVGLRVAICFVK